MLLAARYRSTKVPIRVFRRTLRIDRQCTTRRNMQQPTANISRTKGISGIIRKGSQCVQITQFERGLAVDIAIPSNEFGHTLRQRKLRLIAEQPLGLAQIGMRDRHFSGDRIEILDVCLHAEGILENLD